jgi:hypothetical protein
MVESRGNPASARKVELVGHSCPCCLQIHADFIAETFRQVLVAPCTMSRSFESGIAHWYVNDILHGPLRLCFEDVHPACCCCKSRMIQLHLLFCAIPFAQRLCYLWGGVPCRDRNASTLLCGCAEAECSILEHLNRLHHTSLKQRYLRTAQLQLPVTLFKQAKTPTVQYNSRIKVER